MPSDNIKLTSKIQYKTFEPGEFVDEKKRSYEEVVNAIENFPWEEQRQNIAIDLTCPSITIQNDKTSYLKLGLYYNLKFVLYFFDGENLFSKEMKDNKTSFKFIKEYFEYPAIDLSKYKKENIVFKELNIHFKSGEFIYYVDPKKPLKGLSNITKLFTILILCLFIYSIVKVRSDFIVVVALIISNLFILFLVGGLEAILTLNYFQYSKGKVLKLSRGSEIFEYGDLNNPITYKKADIEQIFVVEDERRDGPLYSIYFFYMANGDVIKITSLHLRIWKLRYKMPDTKFQIHKKLFPYFRSKWKLLGDE